MKKLLILSGKGGTGKTTVASAFIKFAGIKAFADCDVDAPNLHLIMDQQTEPIRTDYMGMGKAKINQDVCTACGLCKEKCRFNAIKFEDGKYLIDDFACEGCGVCEAICPVNAVKLYPDVAGDLMLYKNDTVFSTAQLKMGSGTSGKLVTEVKKQLNSENVDTDIAVIDGSPGIGCPVIASLSGVDMVLIVAEPSLSGISDMERIVKTAEKFQIPVTVCVNKFDTNVNNTEKIEKYCQEMNIPVTGRIPFDKTALKAINSGRSIVEIDCPAGNAVKDVYSKTSKILLENV